MTMTCERAHTLLQDQIDGAIDPAAVRELERHLEGCAACRAFAADLTAIVVAASGLAPIEPPEHVWLQLAGRWRREHPEAAKVVPSAAPSPRRAYARRHMLATAAVLTVAVGGGWIAWRATDGSAPAAVTAEGVLLERTDPAGAGNATSEALVESARQDIEAAEQLYARAIAGLEQAAEGQKELLTPEVAAMLDKNIEVIDEAIVESRRAVSAEPSSVVARESLFEALRKKVTLLQNTISLVTEISRGNQAGAARLTGT